MYRENLRSYQSFKNVTELDLNVRTFLQRYKRELSEGNRKVLKFIWRHSMKYPGVSFAKVGTIGKKTKRSRSTVIRSINRLEAMGLLKRIHTINPNGKRGANLLVIQPIEGFSLLSKDIPLDEIDPEEKAVEPTQEKNLQQQELHSDEIPESQEMDASFLPSYIPSTFIALAKPFLSIEELSNTWRTIGTAYRKVHLKHDLADYMTLVSQAFKQAIYAQKTNQIKKSFNGYLYGGLIQLFIQQVRREVMDDPDTVYYDWLSE